MNEATILFANDEELNEWAGEKIMGYTLYYERIDFEPTTDLNQAFALLNKLREAYQFWWVLRSDLDSVGVEIWNPNTTGDNPILATHQQYGLNYPKAIVIACLLAVAEESQP